MATVAQATCTFHGPGEFPAADVVLHWTLDGPVRELACPKPGHDGPDVVPAGPELVEVMRRGCLTEVHDIPEMADRVRADSTGLTMSPGGADLVVSMFSRRLDACPDLAGSMAEYGTNCWWLPSKRGWRP